MIFFLSHYIFLGRGGGGLLIYIHFYYMSENVYYISLREKLIYIYIYVNFPMSVDAGIILFLALSQN